MAETQQTISLQSQHHQISPAEYACPLKKQLDNLEYTSDLYRCGTCNSDFDLLEDMIIHKLNEENCNLVLFSSLKLNGIQIPRFIQAIINLEDNSIYRSAEQIAGQTNLSQSSSKKEQPHPNQNFVNADAASPKKADERFDQTLSLMQSPLLGSNCKSKARSICSKCGNSYRDATVLKTHLLTVHSADKPYTCDFEDCTFACKTKASLERHVRRHTDERPYVCDSCGRSFRESGTLARHIKSRIPCTRKSDGELLRYRKASSFKKARKQSVTVQKTVQILITKEIDYSTKHLTEEHATEIQIIPNEDSLDLLKKDASQSLIQLLESAAKEAEKSSENSIYQTDEDAGNLEFGAPNKIKEEVAEQLLAGNLSCIVCKFKCKSTDELSQHLQQHLEDFKFRCDKCFFVDKNNDGLDRHIRCTHNKQLHTAVKLIDTWPEVAAAQLIFLHDRLEEKGQMVKSGCFYRCHVCLKKFSQKSYFRLHMNSHTGGAHYECDQCKRTFINKDSLQKHMVTHSSERSFSCCLCPKLFKRQSHLKDHLRTHSDSKPFICKVCYKSFKWQCVLRVHETTHRKECLYCCETCGRQLRNKSSLIRHSKRHKQTGKKASTSSEGNGLTIAAPSFSEKAAEIISAAASISTLSIPAEVPNPQTYLLVLDDDNTLVLGDGTCILENSIMQSEAEDIL